MRLRREHYSRHGETERSHGAFLANREGAKAGGITIISMMLVVSRLAGSTAKRHNGLLV